MDDFNSRSIDEVIAQIRQVVGDSETYLSLDIDVMDPSVAPGTGAVEPGGFSVREIQQILIGLLGVRLVGADLPEVSPLYDETGRTSRVAASLAFDQLCLLAQSRAAQGR